MIVDVRPGDRLELHGGLVSVELVQKSGQLARLRVTAPREVPIRKVSAHGDDGLQVVPSMA